MKRWLAPIAISAGLVVSAAPVLAAPPSSVDVTFDWPCTGIDPPFDATLHAAGKGKTIELRRDRIINISPNFRVTVSGPSAKSVNYVVTGATHVQTLSDGSQKVTATGRNLLLVPEANGHPAGLFLTAGNFSWTLNPDGSEKTLFSGTGKVTDVCQLVAP